jgi:hypothetical protein
MPAMDARLGKSPVEQPQRTRRQREPLREHIEREPVLVQSVHRQRLVLVVVQADPQVDVLQLDVEIHQSLDVDHNGVWSSAKIAMTVASRSLRHKQGRRPRRRKGHAGLGG